ncbi:hypothetical protein PQE66_gp109 [Bacillus phage PBC2]|uniref:Uncharacterized protein n=1 Tax=Bacillus phage PBC2 TaxID=1675029 RepID=A0A218KC12_9CAUD|nr:hypothetical protein PQE66_gp109 [Bacillus phage PBC2]AKQ08424.1 hypothetical protein PBC2_109 [Bacillus phage PBC2]
MSLKLNSDGLIVVDDVVAVEQFGEIQYYTTTVSIDELYSIHDKLTYDGNAQRGEIDGKPEIDKSHVQDIYDAIIDGSSIRGHLTWNMRKLGDNANFEYDEETKS